jgi:HSP20 family molecular chaperone IbpA
MKRQFDWTTGFDLDISAYEIEEHQDKIELLIPVFGASKKEIKITRHSGMIPDGINIEIPDTKLSKKRELLFRTDEGLELKKIKANVRDGILFIHIPFKEEVKPTSIEIT